MPSKQIILLQRLVAALPGWMILLSGLALVAMTLVTPAWLDYRELQWRRDVLRVQAAHLERQAQMYQQFHEALAEDDPAAVQRLAFYNLNRRPAGTASVLDPYYEQRHTMLASSPSEPLAAGGLRTTSIDQALQIRAPRIGADIPPLCPIDARAVRLATNPLSRLGLAIAGLVCLYVGLTFHARIPAEMEADEAD